MILINLLPQELRKKETSKIVLPEIPIKKTLIAIGLSLLGLQLLLSFAALFFVWREASIKQEIKLLTAQVQETRKIKSQTVSVLNKLKDIRGLTEKKFYWASLLNAISASLTKGVWLRNLLLGEIVEEAPRPVAAPVSKAGRVEKTASAGRVEKTPSASQPIRVLRLEGSVVAPGQETAFIGKYVKSLKENAYFTELFRDIELSAINQRKIKEFDVYDFVLFCKFKKGKI